MGSHFALVIFVVFARRHFAWVCGEALRFGNFCGESISVMSLPGNMKMDSYNFCNKVSYVHTFLIYVKMDLYTFDLHENGLVHFWLARKWSCTFLAGRTFYTWLASVTGVYTEDQHGCNIAPKTNHYILTTVVFGIL